MEVNEFEIFTAKSVEDAITEACSKLGVTSDQLDYEVVEEGSSGGFLRKVKPAVINARRKSGYVDEFEPIIKEIKKDIAKTTVIQRKSATAVSGNTPFEVTSREFLSKIFDAMKLSVTIETAFDPDLGELDVYISGDKAGVIIGKHGATLDSLQYITSLVVNKERQNNDSFIRVKVDSENYRERRMEALNSLAQSVALRVRQTRRPSYLEPMNPYERRVIHTALQNNEYVTTTSQGDEPYRKVVVLPRRR